MGLRALFVRKEGIWEAEFQINKWNLYLGRALTEVNRRY